MREQLVVAYYDGATYKLVTADRRTLSSFGGPLTREVIGVPEGRKPLHQICMLSWEQVPGVGGSGVPLIYGMYYDGCTLRYRYNGKIQLIQLNETTPLLDGWPYPNFPPILPYYSLQLEDKVACSYEAFAEQFPNMPEVQPAELVVAVPPPATIGISLWGSGDLDDVTIVFECDLKRRTVHGYNVTT
jgi:hypothetical protein